MKDKILNFLLLPFKDSLHLLKESTYLLVHLLDALKLWSLNLLFPFIFFVLSPILVQNLSDIPLFTYELFTFWLVEGFRFHLVLYIVCLIISITE